ncbi:MAG TPA: T9SS type A sorting domain-containing protein [Ignavibacteria bacterium]|nr:T9SS type A sorting domain-containing protein [Ignavibacteria bacterium]HMR38920.1 T9SS type A sorting domain-containing protein [Ignavibacteria bacterium]
MKRRNLIKGIGAFGLTALLPFKNTFSAIDKTAKAIRNEGLEDTAGCWLTPATTEGPYYLNGNLVRMDITEGRPGLALRMNINVIDAQCNPIPDVLVDVWHCDINGDYSGYNAFVGQTFMRGTQITDASGTVFFDTVYPGWYPGRATHIHFKVRLNSFTYVTSQFCFPDSLNNTIYATPLYIGRGPNPTTNAADGVFHNSNPQYLVMNATPNGTGGYDGNYTIGIDVPTGINDPVEEAKGYSLSQNYPNPFNPVTKIKYEIPANSKVKITVYDGFGKEVMVLIDKNQNAGAYEINFNGGNLSSGYYFYKLEAGEFIQTREMLLIK